jgi:hypothetical protein
MMISQCFLSVNCFLIEAILFVDYILVEALLLDFFLVTRHIVLPVTGYRLIIESIFVIGHQIIIGTTITSPSGTYPEHWSFLALFVFWGIQYFPCNPVPRVPTMQPRR